MKKIAAETQIVINAPLEKVWQIMLDVANYPAWNTFVIRAETQGDVAQPGTKMKLFVKWKNGGQDSSDELITDTKTPYVDDAGVKRAYWSYRFIGKLHALGLVHAIRYQWLQQQADGTTLYSTKEEFTGALKIFIPLAKVQNGFERQARDLKAQSEKK